MDIKSNSKKFKKIWNEKTKLYLKAISLIATLMILIGSLIYNDMHGADNLMKQIKAKKYNIYDGYYHDKVYSYKVLKIDGRYKVETFKEDGSHHHYIDPKYISIIEE